MFGWDFVVDAWSRLWRLNFPYTVHQIQEEPEYGEEEEEEVEVDNLDSEVLEEDVLADTFLTMGQQIDILADEVLNL